MRSNAFYILLYTLVIVFILGSTKTLLAQTGDRVTLSLEKASLQKIFSSVEAQTFYRFVFTNEQLRDGKPVTLSVENETVPNLLKQCFRDQPIYYSIEDKFIIIHRKDKETKINPVDIVGTIKNDKGDPVTGASITVLETLKATTSDAEGGFALQQVPAFATLIFSGTNVEGSQIVLHGQQSLNVILKAKVSKLDEVQVIAYGTATKRLNTGDVSTVMAETIKEQPVANPLEALEGRAPGLVITQNSGIPGSGMFVQIRGQNSIASGNNPLYVIDGVPFIASSLSSIYTNAIIAGGNPLSSINPADIESVNILKDADATSIYGSRGANGVILITTKHGKPGKTKMDFDSYFGFGQIDRSLKLLNTQQYLTMRDEAFKNDGATPSESNGDYDLLLWDTTRYTDWQKLLIGNRSHISDIQLTISGGSLYTQFSLNGGFHRETTVFPGNYEYEKGSVHFDLNHQSQDNKFKLNFITTYGIENNQLPTIDFTTQAMSLPPDAPPIYDSLGKLNWPSGFDNPYSYLNRQYLAKINNLVSHLSLNYTIFSDLQMRLSLGYNNYQMTENQMVPITAYNPAYQFMSGYTEFANGSNETWIIEPQLEYQKKLGPGKLDFLVGLTAEQDITTMQTIFASGFPSDALLSNIAAASTVQVLNNNYTQYRYQAIFGRLNYNIREKYILNITARRDGSSRFGPGNQSANFGAVGAAWIFSSEDFAKKMIPFLSFGKLRSSYGTTGNDQIGNYQYLSTYSPSYYPYQNSSGLVPTSLSNPNYAWETNKKFEVGLDLGFLKDQILFSASYYNNHSSNQLVGYSLPYITGFSSVQENFPAVVRNTGLEFSMNAGLVKSSSFSWSISANLSIPRNLLVSFPNIEQSGYFNQYVVGQPLSIHPLFQYLNVDPNAGIYQFVDSKGKPTLSPLYPDDLKPLKKVAIEYFGGLQNHFQYKGWNLEIFFQFTKQTGWTYLKNYFTMPGMLGNQPAVVMNRWKTSGDKEPFQKFSQSYDSAYSAFSSTVFLSDHVIDDASFIRLKNVSLSYTFPMAGIAKINMQYLRIYLQAQNLFTITSYYGMDPENQSTSSLPPLKVITAGIQFTF